MVGFGYAPRQLAGYVHFVCCVAFARSLTVAAQRGFYVYFEGVREHPPARTCRAKPSPGLLWDGRWVMDDGGLRGRGTQHESRPPLFGCK